MIHAIELENFRSFNGAVRIDFTAKPEKAGTLGYSPMLPCGEVVSRLAVFMGANGSGKTNVLKALSFLGWLIVESAEKTAHDHEYLFPFAANMGKPSHLIIEFSDKGAEIFRYEVQVSLDLGLVKEKLEIKSSKYSTFNVVFDREYVGDKFLFSGDTDKAWRDFAQRPNASLIGSAILSGERPNEDSKAYNFAKRIHAFAKNTYDKIAREFDDEPFVNWSNIGERLKGNEMLLRSASEFVINADIGATGLETVAVSYNDKKTDRLIKAHVPRVKHHIGDMNLPLPFRLESSGTRRVLNLYVETYDINNASGILVIDEIEQGIHPHLLPKLIESWLIGDKESQIILATHSDYLLRHIEHDQIFLTEKDRSGVSDICRANTVEDFKADRNLFNWYHAGKLGGIPRL